MRRWWRVRRRSFLCFFLRMRLRRFLINEPIRVATLSANEASANRRGRVVTLTFRSQAKGAKPCELKARRLADEF